MQRNTGRSLTQLAKEDKYSAPARRVLALRSETRTRAAGHAA